MKTSSIENLGAEFFAEISKTKSNEYFVIPDNISRRYQNFLGFFLHGIKLKSYQFKKYKSKKDKKLITINVSGTKNIPDNQSKLKFNAIEKGTFFTRDLVSEPGNILHPDEYAKRLKYLKKDGLKLQFLMKKLKTRYVFIRCRWEVSEVLISYTEWNGKR